MAQKLDPDVLRVELRYYIDNTSADELQELYDFIDSKQPPYKWWNDEELMAELARREADMISGKDPGVSLDESRTRLAVLLKKDI